LYGCCRLYVRRSLIFLEPTCFGFDPATDNKDAEADLLAVVDGQTIVCEVKSSWQGLRRADIQDFVALSRRLRPNRALLAVMETGTGPAELSNVQTQLAAEGIEYELLTPSSFRVADDPILRVED
jgi:hypothetical protein